MSTKWTPGPWRAGENGNNRVYGPDGMGVHSGLVANVYKGRDTINLIAAAPELYSAAQYALDVIEAHDAASGVPSKVATALRAALAKARGEQ
jgi:hypothetical protein